MKDNEEISIQFNIESLADENQMKKAIDWINDLGYSIGANLNVNPRILKTARSSYNFLMPSDVISVAADIVTIIVGLKAILGKSDTLTRVQIESSYKKGRTRREMHISMVIDSTENIPEQVKQILESFDKGCLCPKEKITAI